MRQKGLIQSRPTSESSPATAAQPPASGAAPCSALTRYQPPPSLCGLSCFVLRYLDTNSARADASIGRPRSLHHVANFSTSNSTFSGKSPSEFNWPSVRVIMVSHSSYEFSSLSGSAAIARIRSQPSREYQATPTAMPRSSPRSPLPLCFFIACRRTACGSAASGAERVRCSAVFGGLPILELRVRHDRDGKECLYGLPILHDCFVLPALYECKSLTIEFCSARLHDFR